MGVGPLELPVGSCRRRGALLLAPPHLARSPRLPVPVPPPHVSCSTDLRTLALLTRAAHCAAQHYTSADRGLASSARRAPSTGRNVGTRHSAGRRSFLSAWTPSSRREELPTGRKVGRTCRLPRMGSMQQGPPKGRRGRRSGEIPSGTGSVNILRQERSLTRGIPIQAR